MEFKRESVFISAMRSFFKTLFTLIAIALVIIVFSMLKGTSGKSIEEPDASKPITAFDADGSNALLGDDAPVILKLEIHGVIGDLKLNTKSIATKLNDSRKSPLGDRIKGIFLHINTPGGTVVDADGIYYALRQYKAKYKVPIYAFVDGLCASGGMYVVSAADKVHATPSSVIGSVGVIMGPNFNLFDLMGKIGVSALTLTEGKDKDTLNPFKQWKPDEAEPIKPILAYYYDRFVSIVTEARARMDKTALVEDYGAKVFDAAMAQQLGYVDVADSDYSASLKDLAAASGIKSDQKYQVVELKTPIKVFSELFESQSVLYGKIKHTIEFPGQEWLSLSNQPLYFYHPGL